MMFNQNKSLLLGILFLFVFSISGVLAYNDLGYYLNQGAQGLQPIAQFFLGGYDYTGYMLFERLLLFILILSITFVALKEVPLFKEKSQKNVVVVLSIVVPLLSVRYLSFEWINTILLTYQAFGIAITSILPFVIYFFFLMGIAKEYPGIRKIGWILFGCVYLGLYTTADNPFYGHVYLWTAVAALAFFLLDGTIQNYFNEQKLKHSLNRNLLTRQLELEGQRKKLIDAGALDSKSPYYHQLKEVDKEIENVHKAMK